MFSAHEQGVLLSDEKPDWFEAEFDIHVKKRNKTDRTRIAKELRNARAREKCGSISIASLAGKGVYVEKGITIDDESITQYGMVKREHRFKSQVFVVDDPAHVGDRTLWAAVLVGGVLMTQEVFRRGRGAIVKYASALATRRVIWASDAFKEKHAGIWAIVEGCHTEMGRASKFKFVAGEDQYLAAKKKALNKRERCSALNLIASKDLSTRPRRLFTTYEEALGIISELLDTSSILTA